MPVQIHNDSPVTRPLGRVEPTPELGGSVEIRLHGVGGTPPEELLGDLAPQLVAGDRIAGFYRTSNQPRQQAGAHSDPRHIEGYSWGGLTSRSASRALWVLMLPFALANVAGWMCREYVLSSRLLFYPHRFAVRLAGLAMTLNVVVLLLMTSEDLIGTQCAGYASCRRNFAPAALLYQFSQHHLGRSMALGSLVPVLVLVLFEVLSRVSTNRYEGVGAPSSPHQDRATTSAQPNHGLADKDFWHGYHAARRLSVLHLAAGLAVVAGVLTWTSHRTLGSGDLSGWRLAIVATSVFVLVAVILSLLWGTTWRWWAIALLVLGCVTVAGALTQAWLIGTVTGPQADPIIVFGMRDIANGTYALVCGAVTLCIAISLLGPVVNRIRHGKFARPRSVSRFLIIGPAIALVFAFMLVNAVGGLLVMRIGEWIGFGGIDDTNLSVNRDAHMYSYISSLATWSMTAVLASIVAFAVVVFVIRWSYRFRDNAPILDDYPPAEPNDQSKWLRAPQRPELNREDESWLLAIARARFLARLPRATDWLLLLIAVVAAATLIIVEYRYLFAKAPIQPVSWLATAASFLAALLPLGLVALMRSSLKSGALRRHIGIAWDVATFWPRAYHPFAPPCYAERAVPDLQWRLWYLQAHGSDVTIAAHSQGTVIAAAALLQRDSLMPDSQVNLLTFGSPLDTLYRWAFPAYFSDEVMRSITSAAGAGAATVPVWRNYFYLTDYIGRTEIEGADNQVINDPPTRVYIYGQPRPQVGSHSGYWTDRAVWERVEDLTAPSAPTAAEPAGPPAPLPQPPPPWLPSQRVADVNKPAPTG